MALAIPGEQPLGDARRGLGHGASQGARVARAAFALAFQHGVDLSTRASVLAAAEQSGLDPAELDGALDDPQLKQALRTATDAAAAEGIYGVPTFDAGGLLWWGDHQLPAAAEYHRSA